LELLWVIGAWSFFLNRFSKKTILATSVQSQHSYRGMNGCGWEEGIGCASCSRSAKNYLKSQSVFL